MTIENYLALFGVLHLVAQPSAYPSITLHGREAGAALRIWAARNATDVQVRRAEHVDETERWSWTTLHVERDDMQVTVLLDDDIRVPVSAVAVPVPEPATEVPF